MSFTCNGLFAAVSRRPQVMWHLNNMNEEPLRNTVEGWKNEKTLDTTFSSLGSLMPPQRSRKNSRQTFCFMTLINHLFFSQFNQRKLLGRNNYENFRFSTSWVSSSTILWTAVNVSQSGTSPQQAEPRLISVAFYCQTPKLLELHIWSKTDFSSCADAEDGNGLVSCSLFASSGSKSSSPAGSFLSTGAGAATALTQSENNTLPLRISYLY